jgi:hypothetical protein
MEPQTNPVVQTQQTLIKEKKSVNVSLILLLLVLATVVGCVLVYLFTDVRSVVNDFLISQNIIECNEETQCEVVDTEDETESENPLTVTNEGYSLYVVPEYGFSIEISDEILEVRDDFDGNFIKKWDVVQTPHNEDYPNSQKFTFEDLEPIKIFSFRLQPQVLEEITYVHYNTFIQVGIYKNPLALNLSDLKQILEDRVGGSEATGYGATDNIEISEFHSHEFLIWDLEDVDFIHKNKLVIKGDYVLHFETYERWIDDNTAGITNMWNSVKIF